MFGYVFCIFGLRREACQCQLAWILKAELVTTDRVAHRLGQLSSDVAPEINFLVSVFCTHHFLPGHENDAAHSFGTEAVKKSMSTPDGTSASA